MEFYIGYADIKEPKLESLTEVLSNHAMEQIALELGQDARNEAERKQLTRAYLRRKLRIRIDL